LPIAAALAAAIESEIAQSSGKLDFRTRLLIRDGLDALQTFWGTEKMGDWLDHAHSSDDLRGIREAALGEAGFPSLVHRIMNTTQPQTVLQFLRELATHCPRPTRLEIGGAIAGILAGVLSRHTKDIDIVDDVPVVLRSQHELLDDLANRFGLRLTHFQSRYLPTGWQTWLRQFDRFGNLQMMLLHSFDLFIGKLFSQRAKDRDDLRDMARQLDKAAMETRLRETTAGLSADARLAKFAADNWFILYGESIPV
jgi:hypothetical protein